ncbi:hypothetical protein [Paenibacillus allorhizoplanae]|uniref:hypothetical protein n=1 Tax=Paenibacillus allorhizoplanae TaxID=2905648 RepID=UPI001F48CAD2|nr:hypothetical protein [Paenibacillus allorhizoplanae]
MLKNELENGILSITLFDDIWDYDNPENRAKQWSFRRYTGIDEIAHALMNSRQCNIHDPSISIETEMACKHGGVRLITYYYNDNGDLVQKTKATKCKIYEFGADGNVICSSEEILK